MSTFLQLVQDLHYEVGAAGTAPTTTVGQRGEALRFVKYIKAADLEIQEMWMNWKFLFANPGFDQTATTNDPDMAAPSDLGMWDLVTFKIIPVGQTLAQPLLAYEYEDVKTEILDTTSAEPWRVIVKPDNTLKLDGPPNNTHRILADYYKRPVALAANTDVSLIPERYHRAILGRAIEMYAEFENAPEMQAKGTKILENYMDRLETHELPNRNYARRRTSGFFEVIGGQSGGVSRDRSVNGW